MQYDRRSVCIWFMTFEIQVNISASWQRAILPPSAADWDVLWSQDRFLSHAFIKGRGQEYNESYSWAVIKTQVKCTCKHSFLQDGHAYLVLYVKLLTANALWVSIGEVYNISIGMRLSYLRGQERGGNGQIKPLKLKCESPPPSSFYQLFCCDITRQKKTLFNLLIISKSVCN